MGLQRWFYAGGRPSRVARVLARFTAAMSARGVEPDYLVTLEVPSRRSRRMVSVPLVVATVDGERYLVSMLGGQTNWLRNVRAAGAAFAEFSTCSASTVKDVCPLSRSEGYRGFERSVSVTRNERKRDQVGGFNTPLRAKMPVAIDCSFSYTVSRSGLTG